MQRVTVTLDDDLLAGLDAVAARDGYASRSEALRDILREALAKPERGTDDAPCVATLSYVYDHETRELARRITHVQHAHHALSVASLHVHLDHETCLEVAVLKGPVREVEAMAAQVTNQRGVRYGQLHVIPAVAPHDHG